MKALQFSRKPLQYAAAYVAGSVAPGKGAAYGPLKLKDIDPHHLPGEGWVRIKPRLAGICGSDLATIDGRSSRYFEHIVSFPFVPGHEVVADTEDGRRVVVEPVLGCVARGIDPVCASCAAGHLGNCERLAFGNLEPGLQSGFCCDTGGGWSTSMVAHHSQLHDVSGTLTDEDAVMIEPAACAVHGVLRAGVPDGGLVVVLGAGTLGLLTIAALKAYAKPGTIVAAARYPLQRSLATELGADVVCETGEISRWVRRLSSSLAYGEQLTGGADVVIDCVGDESTIAHALSIVKPRGRVTLVGMPSTVKLSLTTLWHRETEIVGAYAYGTETLADGSNRRTFELATDLAASAHLGRLVSALYPLRDYKIALEHAATVGRRGAVKVAFDLRAEKERNR